MQYCAVYINQGLNAHREAFSPAIIIEELLLQRFLHTLVFIMDIHSSIKYIIIHRCPPLYAVIPDTIRLSTYSLQVNLRI